MTLFSVAATEDHYKACTRLMLAEDVLPPATGIGFPTVMAHDDQGELIGFIATSLDDDMVIAGPFVLKSDKRRMFTAIKLADMYRDTMLALGINRIIFSSDESESVVSRAIKKWFPEMKPYAQTGTLSFYTWPLDKNFSGD